MLDPLEQVVPDQVTGRGFEPEAGAQPRRLDVGAVSGLLYPGPCRVVGPAPAVLVVEGVAKWTERLLPPRRRDIEAPAGLQVAPCGEDMDVSAAAALAVKHGRPSVAVGSEPCPGRLFEGDQNLADLVVGRSVFRRPGDYARGVLVLERQRVGHGSHLVRIPAQDLDAFALLPGRVPRPEEVVGRLPGRSGPVREELNQHRRPGIERGPAPRAPARWRSGGRSPRRPRSPPCGYSPSGRFG